MPLDDAMGSDRQQPADSGERSNSDHKTVVLERFGYAELSPDGQVQLNEELMEMFESVSTNPQTEKLDEDTRWELAADALAEKLDTSQGENKNLDQQRSESRALGMSF